MSENQVMTYFVLPAVEWKTVKYEKLIPHDLETTPLQLKLDITNNTVDVSFCLMFVPDKYNLDDLSWTLCIRSGSNPAIISKWCKDQQEIPYQSSQFKSGLILWNVTKTGEKLQFDFEVLGRMEHRSDMDCDFDTTWVLFMVKYTEATIEEVFEDRFFYKSSIPGNTSYLLNFF